MPCHRTAFRKGHDAHGLRLGVTVTVPCLKESSAIVTLRQATVRRRCNGVPAPCVAPSQRGWPRTSALAARVSAPLCFGEAEGRRPSRRRCQHRLMLGGSVRVACFGDCSPQPQMARSAGAHSNARGDRMRPTFPSETRVWRIRVVLVFSSAVTYERNRGADDRTPELARADRMGTETSAVRCTCTGQQIRASLAPAAIFEDFRYSR